MSTANQAGSSLQRELVAAYNAFVTGVTPVAVRLVSLHLGANHFIPGDTDALVSELPPRYETRIGGFTAIQPFKLEGSSREGARLSLELELAVDYDSAMQVTPELFEVFGRVNLPLNAHPFVRETVASMTIRAGWPPLVLPAFVKQGRSDSAPGVETAHQQLEG
jgi:hypothetical protein